MTGPSIWIETLMAAAKRPQVVLFRLRLMANNARFRRMRLRFLSELTGADPDVIAQYIREAETDRPLIRAIRAAYRRWTRYIPLPTDFMVDSSGSTMFFHAVSLYALVRVTRPAVVVETGGTPGKS